MAPLILAVLVYLVLSLWLAHTKAPWCDEAWFVNPAYNLAFHGRMGLNVLEPSGHYLNAYLRGVQERTYIFPPNHLVALAGWFRVFGFSAFIARVYSICWSALTLVALFYILLQFFPDPRVAQLTVLLVAIDFIFLWSTADGRPEAMANSLVICSVAAYLHFRETSLPKAIFISQLFAAAGVFAHMNAALIVFSLIAIALYLDHKRLRMRYLDLAVVPYILFALLWLVYILQKPSDFVSQFFPQVGYAERWRGILRPDIAIWTEFLRQIAAYAIDDVWTGIMNGWISMIVPILYLAAVIWFFRTRRELQRTEHLFLIFALVLMTGMTILNGFKGCFYLLYIVPIYDAILVAWLLNLWGRSTRGRRAAFVIALGFVVTQLSLSIRHIQTDEYHRDYEPTIRELARDRAQGKSIVGTAALGFGLDFNGFKDDIRLGMYSGLSPDVVVTDRSYRLFASRSDTHEPSVVTHINAMLSRYTLTAQHGSFWIFERVPPGANGKVLPWIDAHQMEAVEKGKRADYFFRLMFSAGKMLDPEESSL